MKPSLKERFLENPTIYLYRAVHSKTALVATCLLFYCSVIKITVLSHTLDKSEDNHAKTIEQFHLLSNLNTPCSLEDSRKLEEARVYTLALSKQYPLSIAELDFTLFGFPSREDQYLPAVRTQFESALQYNEFRCPTANLFPGFTSYNAGTFVDVEFDVSRELLRPGVIAFSPDLLSSVYALGESDKQSTEWCALIGLLAHETLHSMIPLNKETPTILHDTQRNDAPYKVGYFFKRMCLNGS